MEFGQIEIETDRLLLRRLQASDVKGIYAGYSDEKCMVYWSHTAFTDISQAEKLIENEMKWWDAGSAMRLAITLKDSQEFAGTICLHSFHEISKRAEIGYLLNQKYWQQAIMSEAIKAVVDYAFQQLGLNRIEADIDPENKASAALLTKTGFKREGLLKQRWIVGGMPADSEIYGLLKSYI